MKISGGSISTPYLVAVSPGIVADESKTPRWVNQLIVTDADLAAIQIGGPPPAGRGDHVIDISDASPMGSGLLEVRVTAIGTPNDYTMRELLQVTILPEVRGGMTNEQAMRVRSSLRPKSILLNCERAVSFVESTTAAGVNPPPVDVPTFEGVPVDFYGTVYDDEGKAIGWTRPLAAPRTIVVDRRMEPWLGTFYKLTTITAERPLFS